MAFMDTILLYLRVAVMHYTHRHAICTVQGCVESSQVGAGICVYYIYLRDNGLRFLRNAVFSD